MKLLRDYNTSEMGFQPVKLKYVIKFIRNIDSFIKPENKIPDKMQAFQNLEKLRLHLPDDFDYEKELEESRKFKFGSIN